MSGGSMDYLCFKIEEQVYRIPDREIRELAIDFAKLMKECEWYTSCDTGKETWLKAANDFKNKWFGKRDQRLQEIVDSAIRQLHDELTEMISAKN